MMAASMGPNFTGHPAGMGHPAVAGHAMVPGMPPNAGQQGAPGAGMPHQFAGHMGVPPGGQMNPAMMAGMPPGVNPGMHPGMQHVAPHQQQQLFQQQQQHLQSQMHNPAAIANLRQQQQFMAQRQQALMAQQIQMQQQQGMGMGGMQLNPQQMQQFRAAQQAARLQPNQPQQAMVAQQVALQQQQQAQQQQAQQAQQQQAHQAQQQHGGPQGQIAGGPQQGQGMPMNAQMHNMQQGQMGGAPQGQNPGQQQGQQGPQGQPQGQQGQPQPQSGQQQSQPQNPQQGSQAGTPGPSGQQTPSQTPAATPAQSNQPPQGGLNPAVTQAQGQPSQQAQPQPLPQQQAPINAYSLMPGNMMAQQQRTQNIKGQCMIKVMQFCEGLSGFPGSQGKDDLTYWVHFVRGFFSPNGVLRHQVHSSDSDDDKQYEITYPAIARYFHTHFSSGVKVMQLMLDKVAQEKPLPGDGHYVEYGKSSLVYWFDTGSHLVARGTLRLQFDAEQKLDLFEFRTLEHEEYLSRKQVIEAAKPAHAWLKEWHKVNSDNKQSPEMTKKGKAKALKSPQTQAPADVLGDLPHQAVTKEGLTMSVLAFLEVVEVMGQMNPLFSFYQTNPGLAPYSALEQYVATQINNVPHPTMNGVPQVPGPGAPPRTPSFGNFMGQSPGAANLPGSPHVSGSPAPGPGQMQAPNMALQASQQGTSSSGPSANTSPASNKRRRPSGVKTEDADTSGAPAGVNGVVRGKPATPRMQKRAKTNAS